ncbi:hypothetical protein IAT40_004788 [Kwoniella sp. CBS 6097]
MSKLSLGLGLLWLAFLAVPAAAFNTYMGCYNEPASESVLITNANLPANSALPTDSVTCGQVCQAFSSAVHYSMWLGSSGSCYCSTESPDARVSYLNSGNSDACSNNGRYHARMLGTTMSLVGQYSTVTFTNSAEQPAQVNTMQECFQHCVDSTQASLRIVRAADNYFNCYCSPITSAGTATGSTSSFYVYTHEAGAYAEPGEPGGPSGFVKRQMRERLQIARERALQAICPNNLTACRVSPGEGTSFECIDIQTELESCGGCAFGEYNNATAPLGQDCSVGGAALGASTCIEGKCVSFACKAGYTLVNGDCVAL